MANTHTSFLTFLTKKATGQTPMALVKYIWTLDFLKQWRFIPVCCCSTGGFRIRIVVKYNTPPVASRR